MDILLRIVRCQEEQLCDDGVRNIVVDRTSQKDNPILQKTGVNIVRPFSPIRLFNDYRHQIHATNLLG
ncbi:hypothetical protein D3C85_1595810 [compost metagenome]